MGREWSRDDIGSSGMNEVEREVLVGPSGPPCLVRCYDGFRGEFGTEPEIHPLSSLSLSHSPSLLVIHHHSSQAHSSISSTYVARYHNLVHPLEPAPTL